MPSDLDRRVPLRSAPNLRDLGGLNVDGGVTKAGEVYRSATLAKLAGDDAVSFARLDVRTVYDLRTSGEREASPDNVPDDVRIVGLDVLADSPDDVAAKVSDFADDPSALVDVLGDGRAAKLMQECYRNIVRLPSALASYRAFYLDLIDATRTGAALFHCTTGKDRTGWAAASFLLLLGVGEDDVRADYLETNTDLLPALQPLIDAAASRGLDPALLTPVIGVDDSYLDAALAEMRTVYGSIQDYAVKGLGLTTDDLTALRARFVESPR